jgi:hypothetical protein
MLRHGFLPVPIHFYQPIFDTGRFHNRFGRRHTQFRAFRSERPSRSRSCSNSAPSRRSAHGRARATRSQGYFWDNETSDTTVHVHDVYLPFEYPREYSMRERARYFWNEQYVLHAFLALNNSFRVELAGYWAQLTQSREFASAFPGFDPSKHGPTSSFYLSTV